MSALLLNMLYSTAPAIDPPRAAKTEVNGGEGDRLQGPV